MALIIFIQDAEEVVPCVFGPSALGYSYSLSYSCHPMAKGRTLRTAEQIWSVIGPGTVFALIQSQ